MPIVLEKLPGCTACAVTGRQKDAGYYTKVPRAEETLWTHFCEKHWQMWGSHVDYILLVNHALPVIKQEEVKAVVAEQEKKYREVSVWQKGVVEVFKPLVEDVYFWGRVVGEKKMGSFSYNLPLLPTIIVGRLAFNLVSPDRHFGSGVLKGGRV